MQSVILKLEKRKATSPVIVLLFRNILFACDGAFQRKPYETSVLVLHLENCVVLSLRVCSLLLRFRNYKGCKKAFSEEFEERDVI